MDVQTVALITAAVLILAIFYLLRSITRRRAVMKFLHEKGHLLKKMPASAPAKKAAPAKKKKAAVKKKKR